MYSYRQCSYGHMYMRVSANVVIRSYGHKFMQSYVYAGVSSYGYVSRLPSDCTKIGSVNDVYMFLEFVCTNSEAMND